MNEFTIGNIEDLAHEAGAVTIDDLIFLNYCHNKVMKLKNNQTVSDVLTNEERQRRKEIKGKINNFDPVYQHLTN